jgi:hypothetical protein
MIILFCPDFLAMLMWTALGTAIIAGYLNRRNYSWHDPIATICMCLSCGFVLGPLAFFATLSKDGNS